MNDSDLGLACPSWGWSGGGTCTHSSPPQCSPWDYVEAIGIVHLDGCPICRQYMDHRSDAAEVDDSFAQAARERDEGLHNRFLEGFRRGRDAQRQHDNERLRFYYTQRNEAHATNLVYEEELGQAKEEISRLRDELFALRLSYDELLLIHRTPDSGGPSEEVIPLALLSGDLGFELIPDEDSSDGSSGVESLPEEDSNGGSEDRRAADVLGSRSGGRLDHPQVLHSDGQHIHTFVDTGDNPPNDISPENHIAIGGRSPMARSSSTLPPECYALEEAVKELTSLLDGTHMTQTVIQPLVRTIASEIQSSHSQYRDEGQELPEDWRYLSPGPTRKPLKIYVDASDIGIGFMFGDKWQTWGLKDGWKTRQREIQWAEAAAAELGLRLMIQAGYAGRRILLFSDNSTVVQAFRLSSNSPPPPQIEDIVDQIDTLCASHKIGLQVEWVRGTDNPADGPSRMRSRDQDKRFPHDIEIPPHLEDFVFPVDFIYD